MPKIIPTGAYVILSIMQDKVVHFDSEDGSQGNVRLAPRDEHCYREQQIWWVERCPECKNFDSYPRYLITNMASGGYLSTKKGGGDVGVCRSSSGFNEMWGFEAGEGSEIDQLYGNLFQLPCINAPYEARIELFVYKAFLANSGFRWGTTFGSGTKYVGEWDFLEPDTRFPAGWFEIGSMLHDAVLGQTYLTSPPVLVKTPKADTGLPLPMYRERWATQWRLLRRPSTHSSDGPENESKNMSWIIENRLTGGRLESRADSFEVWAESNGSAVSGVGSPSPLVEWILELHGGETSWRIENEAMATYLRAASLGEVDGAPATPLSCRDNFCRRFPGDPEKKWCFRYAPVRASRSEELGSGFVTDVRGEMYTITFE